MVTLRAEPVGRWTVPETPDALRIDGQTAVRETVLSFTWEDLTACLERAGRIGATEIVLGIDADPDEIAAGNLVVGSFPGVRVSFDSRHGRLVFHSDRYNEWRLNVVEVAGLLEALAEADNYSAGGRQYAGFREQPAAAGPPEPLTPTRAAELLIDLAGLDDEDPAELLESPGKVRRALLIVDARDDLTREQRGTVRVVRGALGPVADQRP